MARPSSRRSLVARANISQRTERSRRLDVGICEEDDAEGPAAAERFIPAIVRGPGVSPQRTLKSHRFRDSFLVLSSNRW